MTSVYELMDRLNRSSNIKYIGVIIDHKLNCCEHIAHVKVSKGIGILYKARQFLDKKSLHIIYYSYIQPYLIYCLEVSGSACQTHLHHLFLYKEIVRIITFSHYLAHTQPLFVDLFYCHVTSMERALAFRADGQGF